MASASVLGSTTGHGYPIGDAVGVGSMMEANSEAVAGNVAPLILSVSTPLKASEELELLSMEWDLERTPGPEILPEQLVVAGGYARGVSSHVSMLTWEKGIADPFNIEERVELISKKLADLEAATSASGLGVENEGLAVLRKFSGRLNRTLFLDMLDRQFQGSWSTLRIKPEDVDVELVIRQSYRKDFTTMPPGVNISERSSPEFLLPDADDAALTEHFKHRILSPSAVRALSVQVPEIGRAILKEMNRYAYSGEEADIARALTAALVRFLGRTDMRFAELDSIAKEAVDFTSTAKNAIRILGDAVEQHVSSGTSLRLAEHKERLDTAVESLIVKLPSPTRDVVTWFLHEMTSAMMKSAGGDLPGEVEFKAWQLKSATGYFLTYARKVSDYFAEQLYRFLIVSFARAGIMNSLHSLHQEMLEKGLSPTDLVLFNMLYDELLSKFKSALGRRACEGTTERNPGQLMVAIVQEIVDEFSRDNPRNMAQFRNMVQVARSEIEAKHKVEERDGVQGLDRLGEALLVRLSDLETLVTQTLQDIADTLLSKRFITQLADLTTTEQSKLSAEFIRLVELQEGKSAQWKSEARRIVNDALQGAAEGKGTAPRLLMLTQNLHEAIRTGPSTESVLQRVKSEAERLQAEYEREVEEWEIACSRIESENVRIRDENETREGLLKQASADYARETAQYEQLKQAYDPSTVPGSPPEPPETLEQRVLRIERAHPVQMPKSMPTKPEAPEELLVADELRDTIAANIETASRDEKSLQSILIDRLNSMRDQPANQMGDQVVNIADGFHEYLLESTIRSIGKLLPRASRVYLKSPEEPDLIYLVSYEYKKDEMMVQIGSNFLR